MKIEKNINIPRRKRMCETLRKMSVGDSIIVESDSEYNSIWQWFNRNGKQCKRLKENDGRIRIWRTL